MKNLLDLTGKTILITGASSGIGKSSALLCSKLGASLIITGRNEIKLNNVFSLLEGNKHLQFPIDFENENSINELCSKIDSLDGIIHSAGIALNSPFKFTNIEKLSKILHINFEIPFTITQVLLKEKKINKESSIVFVSSVSGYNVVARGISAYSASKGAISASIRVMALELSSRKIRVNAVCPGMVNTEMNLDNSILTNEDLKTDEFRNYPLGYGKPEDVANAIVFLLSDASSWITGTNLVIDGGASIH
jgi:NAD(P)-dependent dehydrogenase (short-subunit alcohol dehydrogenase family)